MSDTAKFILKIIGILLLIFLGVYLVADIFNFCNDAFGLNIGANKSDVVVDKIENTIPILTNGDLTEEEIKQQKKDIEAPTCDDVFNDYYIYETETYVFVLKKDTKDGKNIYPNLSFIKTENGTLQYDGTVGIKANLDVNWFSGIPDFNTLTFDYDYSLGMNYEKGVDFDIVSFLGGIFSQWNAFHNANNFVSYTNYNVNYCDNFLNMFGPTRVVRLSSGAEENDKRILKNKTFEWLGENILPYFIDLGDDVEFIMSDKTLSDDERQAKTMSYLNSYATYMWNQTKTSDKTENQKIVDLSDYFAKFIYDENVYKQYPIPASKKSEYPNQEYYTVYNCKILGNVSYVYNNQKIDGDKLPDDGDFDITPPPIVTKEYSKVTFLLINKDNSDIENLNLLANPVTIKINDKVLTFDDKLELQLGKCIALEKDKTYIYEIASNGLLFDSYSGSFEVKESFLEISLEYTYSHGFAYTTISLMPITATDSSGIDLSANPVRIVFTGLNGEGTYQFVFDSNDKLTSEIGQFLKTGEYSYSVLSEQLIFSSTSGNQKVDANNRKFAFTYSINTYQNDLKFTVVVEEQTISTAHDLRISATQETTILLGQKIGQTSYSVVVKIFDKDGYILKTLNHLHGVGGCSDSWSSNGVLKDGETYTGQLLYQNTDDLTKSYVSGTFTFTYQSGTVYTFVYACEEI